MASELLTTGEDRGMVMMTSRSLTLALTLAWLVGLAGHLQAAPQYRYYTTGQGDGSMAVAINDNNQALVNFNDRAYLWTLSGGLTDLGDLGGGKSFGYDINNLGQIVGESYINATTKRAFLWESGNMQNLGLQAGGTDSMAGSINNLGQVLGYTVYGDDWVPFIWTQAGGLQPLDLVGGLAFKIKDDGRMVGTKNNHAWLWTAPGPGQDLGTLPGFSYAEASDINQSGQVVGWAGNNPENHYFPCRALSWTQGGGLQDLGTPGGPDARALAINKDGLIAGWADYNLEGFTAGCLWTPGGDKLNLNTLVVNPPAGKIGDGIAINAQGVIVGQMGGGGAAYMLVPTIVPPTANPAVLDLLLFQ